MGSLSLHKKLGGIPRRWEEFRISCITSFDIWSFEFVRPPCTVHLSLGFEFTKYSKFVVHVPFHAVDADDQVLSSDPSALLL